MKTIWRKESNNRAPKAGLGYTSTVRRVSAGWQWHLMIQAESVATGRARTKLEAQESVRSAKSARNGKRGEKI